MEVATAFAGIILGWALGLASQVWMEKRRARRAARLVTIELLKNGVVLDTARTKAVYDWVARPGLQTSVWEAHATDVLGLLGDQETETVQRAYIGLGDAQRVVDATYNAFTKSRDTRDEAIRIALRDFEDAASQSRDRGREGKPAAPVEELRAIFDVRRKNAEEAHEQTRRGLDATMTTSKAFLDDVAARTGNAARIIHDKALAKWPF